MVLHAVEPRRVSLSPVRCCCAALPARQLICCCLRAAVAVSAPLVAPLYIYCSVGLWALAVPL